MQAIRVTATGGPEALELADGDDLAPGMGEAVVTTEAAGLNFIDVYQRSGAYPMDLPFVPGSEGAGTVAAVGDGVTAVAPGDRVAWVSVPGSYAAQVVAPVDKLVAVPDGVETRTAAAVMLQGITAHYLATSTFPLAPGHTALVYAAAGGVGHLLTQIAVQRGARVIATASDDEKARLAREAGADEVVRYRQVDVAEAVADLTDREGVDVVYDSVGADTFARSLACLRPRGTMVLYGQSSGPVPPLDPQELRKGGSLFLTRPTIAHYTQTRGELVSRAGDLFDWIRAGELEVRIDRTWPLAEAAEAHRYIEAGRTRGKVLLLP